VVEGTLPPHRPHQRDFFEQRCVGESPGRMVSRTGKKQALVPIGNPAEFGAKIDAAGQESAPSRLLAEKAKRKTPADGPLGNVLANDPDAGRRDSCIGMEKPENVTRCCFGAMIELSAPARRIGRC